VDQKPDSFLKLSEVGNLLQVSVRTVHRLIATRELLLVKVGRSSRVPASSYREYVARLVAGRR
jgi:excisionase family DNA binding protein